MESWARTVEWCRPLAESGGSWLVSGLAASLAFGYVLLVTVRRGSRRPWPWWRATAFVTGMLVLVVASRLGSGEREATLVVHAWQHVLVGMWAPLAVVLAAPLTLVLTQLPAARARRVMRWLRSRWMAGLVHPVTAYLLGAAAMLPLVLTPLYGHLIQDAFGHRLLHAHFFLSGILLTWVVAGQDPAPHRASFRARVMLLLAGAGTHAFLAKVMFAFGYPRGLGAPLADVQAAAQVMYYGGDLAELVLATMVFASWYRKTAARAPTPADTRCLLPA